MVDRFCAWALFLNSNGIRFDPPKSRFDDAGEPPAPGKAAQGRYHAGLTRPARPHWQMALCLVIAKVSQGDLKPGSNTAYHNEE